MRPKSLLLLALALGCGLVASIGISQVMDANGKRGANIETAPIYVALHNINLGDPIDATMVSLQEWPKDKIPAGAITQLEDLEGRRPRTNIIAGETILDGKLLGDGEFADPIAQIPPGYRLSTISVNAEKSAAGLLSPGDRVDVQLYMSRDERNGVPTATTRVILQNARVYAIESAVQRSADGGEARTIPKTVSLVVKPEQASKIDLAQNLGELSLIPRNPNDDATGAVVSATLDDIMGTTEKNTRSAEQGRDGVEKTKKKSGSFFGSIAGMMRKAAEDRPPFEMEIVRADEVSTMMFDSTTGKPLREYNEDRNANGPKKMGSVGPTPAGEQPAGQEDFPIDFGGSEG